ncbi:hypothetical protein [Desulfococcus multivorans]|uniref:Uncharacterized protein n=1 Tax=Desulfococcus multivorans DSM 2059 TaxID=1121405 RepID=S7U4V3_DESML|nr:hypothetical protein [Desulfococcus multivorans]AQV01287.1 hypothetical protein B2D07_11285 [Desulfococcus multivorans]EPR44055.1 hypothetical protein dsmv_3827 [Desulfococcus multivorans DSM 2059]SKA29905.1 hypothetical protein SAMN02745446_03868 [Desulfococcus multivorans DSM 2059]
MSGDETINSILSLVSSDLISKSLKKAFINCLERYLRDKKTVHIDELNYIKQEINHHAVQIKQYSEEDAYRLLHEQEKPFFAPKEPIQKTAQNSGTENCNFENKISKQQPTIDQLNEMIEELRHKGKQAVASRDNWKQKAEKAERKVKELENKVSKLELQKTDTDSKFKRLKNKFALMYHPDKIMGEKYEKMIKQEFFKEFWQEIEIIERS